MKRIFVVGCPRSGTTLVQGILAAHSGLTSFPESHIFTGSCFDLKWRMYGRLLGRRRWPAAIAGRIKNRLGIAAPSVQTRIQIFLERAQLESDAARFRDISNDMRKLTDRFVELLDHHGGKVGWVEKTPNHVFCIPMIERYVDNPRFIHVVREGPDTIASIVDASRKYEDWGKRYLTGADNFDRVIALWKRSTETSFRHKNKANHLIVRHKDIVADPCREIKKIVDFLGISYETEMVKAKFSDIIIKSESWKNNIGQEIKEPESKFDKIFTQSEKKYINKRVFEV